MPCGRIEAVSWPDHLILMADSAGQRPRLIGIKVVCHKCKLKRATKKGLFCVTLDSEILMYDCTLRFSHLRKP